MFFEQIANAFAKQLSLQIFFSVAKFRLKFLQQRRLKNSSIALIAIALIAKMCFGQIVKAFAKHLPLQIFDFLKNLRLGFLQQTSLNKSSIALAAAQLSMQSVFFLTNWWLEFL